MTIKRNNLLSKLILLGIMLYPLYFTNVGMRIFSGLSIDFIYMTIGALMVLFSGLSGLLGIVAVSVMLLEYTLVPMVLAAC